MPQRKRGRPPVDDVLTPTEWRVLNAIRHGLSNPAIAKRRGISLDAVKFHVANIVSKLGVENRRALRTWHGAPKASALARTESHVMNGPASISAIGQIARSVTNVAASEAWYRDVLGLTHLFTFGTLAFFDVGGVRLMLSTGSAAATLYFRVDDVDTTLDRLRDDGVTVTGEPHVIFSHVDDSLGGAAGQDEWQAFVEDSEGNLVGLVGFRPTED